MWQNVNNWQIYIRVFGVEIFQNKNLERKILMSKKEK